METMNEMTPSPRDLIPLAREALDQTPTYVEHIFSTFSASGQSIREGNDKDGLTFFARGASDLAQFIELFEQMASISNPPEATAMKTFRINMASFVNAMQTALTNMDLVTLSDEIEVRSGPLFNSWGDVQQELQIGLESQPA